jgi:signal transduction histidine kinase/ActR/RegA family two-component response regulator
MKLRSQIFLLLFLFGLVPLFAAVVINVPLVFERIESLYHKAYLQNLRAGFSDLDQHLARRHETVRLLAKFPEPGMLLSAEEQKKGSDIDLKSARSGYVAWLNQVLFDQLDVIRVLFINDDGKTAYWLERDNATGRLEPRTGTAPYQNPEFIKVGQKLRPGNVLTGPIIFDQAAGDQAPNKFMQLGFVSPIVTMFSSETVHFEDKRGVVIVYLDVGGLASAYRGIYWAFSDGRYLDADGSHPEFSNAFKDFPGVQDLFAKGELGLWEYKGQQVLWVPLFVTEKSGPLWVGRSVDPSPIVKLRNAIEFRVISIVLGLLVVVLVIARLIALSAERLGHELTEGISRVMEYNEVVRYSWQRPEELRELGENLTRLAETNAERSKALLDYARELEETNRFKSEFLANVSHELRTPLNSILLLSKMLADSDKGKHAAEDAKQARVIHDAGTDLKALIDNILDLSRIEAKQMTLMCEQVNLRAVLESVLELLKPQYDEKGLSLKLDIDAGAPEHIQTDREKLRQILINFLSNAVKFTREGGVSIQLQSCAGTQDDRFAVCIRVIDTGIGIPADKQEIIFEAFKQADGSTSRRFGGTGLGLAISRELASLMGGEIRVESQPGAGSAFTLLLPEIMSEGHEVEKDGSPAAGNKQGMITEASIPDADYRGTRVLLVDDDMRNLLALIPLMERWGITVMAAGDGHEALETLESGGDFDLVLMDIMMPDLDGYEVTRRIRSQPRFAHLPVIALTARASADDRRYSLEAGANDCLVKPVDPQDLKTILDIFLVDRNGRGDQ